MSLDLVAISKAVSHALRHDPSRYGLAPDAEGWVDVADLLRALGTHRQAWAGLTAAELDAMMANSAKRRFEVLDGRIRASYGHSMPARIERVPTAPPDVLYHGTRASSVPAILAEGLRRMARQNVHLSADVETAAIVGSRRGGRPVILRVDAAAAHAAGVPFFHVDGTVWLSDSLDPGFLAVHEPEHVPECVRTVS